MKKEIEEGVRKIGLSPFFNKTGIRIFGGINIVVGAYFFAELVINGMKTEGIAMIPTGIGPTAYLSIIGQVAIWIPLILLVSGIGIWKIRNWGIRGFFCLFLCNLFVIFVLFGVISHAI